MLVFFVICGNILISNKTDKIGGDMLQRENKQKDFFDDYVYKRLLPKKHILLDIKSKINFSFVEEITISLYSDNPLISSFSIKLPERISIPFICVFPNILFISASFL